MAWERRGAGRYYYRWRKVPGGFVREYGGTGPAGERAAAEDARRRAEREARAGARRAEQARGEGADGPAGRLCDQTDWLVRAALLIAGYHRADRHWRKRRDRPAPDEAG
jgi:hypothetical protein